jgi:hypothetical protein
LLSYNIYRGTPIAGASTSMGEVSGTTGSTSLYFPTGLSNQTMILITHATS